MKTIVLILAISLSLSATGCRQLKPVLRGVQTLWPLVEAIGLEGEDICVRYAPRPADSPAALQMADLCIEADPAQLQQISKEHGSEAELFVWLHELAHLKQYYEPAPFQENKADQIASCTLQKMGLPLVNVREWLTEKYGADRSVSSSCPLFLQ